MKANLGFIFDHHDFDIISKNPMSCGFSPLFFFPKFILLGHWFILSQFLYVMWATDVSYFTFCMRIFICNSCWDGLPQWMVLTLVLASRYGKNNSRDNQLWMKLFLGFFVFSFLAHTFSPWMVDLGSFACVINWQIVTGSMWQKNACWQRVEETKRSWCLHISFTDMLLMI
jgi:hypothetical protein